ncbi:hypothetical protein JCM10213_007597 [Rhodosporidiobolus nylandii]
MPPASYRGHTYGVWREAFTESKLSFREWNKRVYEPWLKAAYDQSIKPYYLQPSHIFNKYDGEYARGVKESLKQADICQLWRSKTVKEREEAVLLTWERQARRAETGDLSYRRDCTPGLVLKWADDPYNFEDLVRAQLLPPNSDFKYRIVRNKEWERLNAPASSLPPSRGTREFVEEEGYLDRHLFLAQFTTQLIFAMTGMPEEERDMIRTGVKPSKEDYEAASQSWKTRGLPITVGSGATDGVQRCTTCLAPETEKKLTCCAKCKAIGRLVWYCGRDCQVKDYKGDKGKQPHKKQCGKPLAETAAPFDPTRQNFASPAQLRLLEWLRSMPRCVWAVSDAEEDGRGGFHKERTTVFNLPSFVSRYCTTLSALHAIREKASSEKDDISIGIIATFISLVRTRAEEALEGQRTFKPVQLSEDEVKEHLDILALYLEFEADEQKSRMERAMLVAEEAVAEKEEYEVIKALFEQLKTGKADLAYGSISPSSANHLDHLLADLRSFFTFPALPLKAGKADLPSRLRIPLPEDIKPFEPSVAAIRSLAFRAIESSERDSLAVGVLMLFVSAAQGDMIDGQNDAGQCDNFCADLGLPAGRVQQLRNDAEGEFEKQEGGDWELLRQGLKQLRELRAGDGRAGREKKR